MQCSYKYHQYLHLIERHYIEFKIDIVFDLQQNYLFYFLKAESNKYFFMKRKMIEFSMLPDYVKNHK